MYIKEALQEAYLDYINDYLTVEYFASVYGLSTKEAELLIDLGRLVHERIVEDHRSGISEQ